MAVNKSYKGQEHINFYLPVLFGKAAERLSKAEVRKGCLLFIMGNLDLMEFTHRSDGPKGILWITITARIFLFQQSRKLAKKYSALSASLKQADKKAKADIKKPTEAGMVSGAETKPSELAIPAKPVPDSRKTETMLLHISLQITEKLKSAYLQSIWQ